MECLSCAASIPDVSVFCLSCGADLRRTGTAGPEPQFFAMPAPQPAAAVREEASALSSSPRSAPPQRTVDEVAYSRSPVYAGPGMESSGRLAELPRGTVVEVLERDRSSGIVRVRVGNDVQGYMQAIALKGQIVPARSQPPSTTGRWECPNCHERHEDSFLSCWKCLTSRPDQPPAEQNAVWSAAVANERRSPAYSAASTRPAYSAATRRADGRIGYQSMSPSSRSMAARWLFLGGAIAMFVCPFLPWLSAFGESANLSDLSKSGVDSAVAEVVVIALVGTLGAALRLGNVISHVAARFWAGSVGLFGLIELIYFNSQIDDHFSGSGVSRQFGFYLLLLAGIALIISAFLETPDEE